MRGPRPESNLGRREPKSRLVPCQSDGRVVLGVQTEESGSFTVAEAVRAEPGSDASRWLAAWSKQMDDASWRALLRELERIARALAPSYRDVADPEDVLGELLMMSCDRWLPRYLAELTAGEAKTSLRSYLTLRLKAHLSEERRKRARRRRLMRAAVPPQLERGSEPDLAASHDDPHDNAVARELMDLDGADEELREVLGLRLAGFSQAEIAERLQVSRPTVSRRLGAIGAILAAMTAGWLIATLAPTSAPREHAKAATKERPTSATGEALAARFGDLPAHRSPYFVSDPDVRAVGERAFHGCWLSRGTRETTIFDVRLTTDAAGAVTEVDVSDGPEGLRECIEEQAAGLVIPHRARQAIVTRVGTPELSSEDRLSVARTCFGRGEYECTIYVLENHAASDAEVSLLADAYERLGDAASARDVRERVPEQPPSL